MTMYSTFKELKDDLKALPAKVGSAFFVDFFQALYNHCTDNLGDEEIRRAKICAGCDDKEKKGYPDFLNSKMVEINGFVCKKCSCPIATKIFAKEEKHICHKWKD